jgi:hypothetical protein
MHFKSACAIRVSMRAFCAGQAATPAKRGLVPRVFPARIWQNRKKAISPPLAKGRDGSHLARYPIAWKHAIDRKSRQINKMAHVLAGEPVSTSPDHARGTET